MTDMDTTANVPLTAEELEKKEFPAYFNMKTFTRISLNPGETSGGPYYTVQGTMVPLDFWVLVDMISRLPGVTAEHRKAFVYAYIELKEDLRASAPF